MSTIPICSIVPPHIFDHLSNSANVRLREAARVGFETTARLRGQRDILELMPAFNTTPGVKRRTVYDAHNLQRLPGVVVRGEGSPPSGDIAVDQAYDGAGTVWDFYKQVFNRDSADDRGMRLDSTVHYGSAFDNAFWNGSQMVYGDGDGIVLHNLTSALEVIGHELTHGVTQNASGLVYAGESGALNEHISDVFGVLIKQRTLNQTAAQADWLVGASVLVVPNPLPAGGVARALRDMLNPGTAYANIDIGTDPQPSHYAQRYLGTNDHGGVHINSGIPNKAFATFAVAVGSNAWDVPGKIWYKVATASGLPPSATMSQFKALTLAAAQQIAPTTSDALKAAWAAVGVA